MKSKKILGIAVGLVAAMVSGPAAGQTAGSAFTYQGQLKDDGHPADGLYDLQFSLYDGAGTIVGGPITTEDQQVTNGLFNVVLDFGGSLFTGDTRFLEIGVRPGASVDAFTVLWPRQELTPAPYASTAMQTVGVDGHSLDAVDGSPTDAVYVDANGKVRMDEGDLVVHGKVGIGTDTPAYDLDVGGNAGFKKNAWFTSAIPFEIAHVSNTGMAIDPGIPSLSLEADGNNIVTVTDSGVGIGVTSPTAELDVNGQIKARGFRLGSMATAGYVLTTDASGVGSWQPAGAGGSLWTVAGNGIYYDAGYVGVGTDSPNYPLHVADWSSTPVIVGDNRNEVTVGQLGANEAGVYGEAGQTWAKGVYGLATGTSQTNYGVYGESASNSGYGVFGQVTGSSGCGVRGNAFNGAGVHGEASGPYGVGVSGYTQSPTSPAIHAHNEAETGNAVAVWAESGVGFAGYFNGKGYFSKEVGIGTDAPDYPLHVIDWTGSSAIVAENPSESSTGILGSELGGVYGESARAVYGNALPYGGFGGYFAGKGYFSGDVGVGTEYPAEKLDVVGTVKMTGLQLGDAASNGYVLTADANGVGSWQPPVDNTLWESSTNDIYYNAGRVGIGTDAPQYDLHVVSTNGGSSVIVAENIAENTYGVLGGEHHGVYGESRFGVYGVTVHETGQAVTGISMAPTGINYGVFGQAYSPDGYAGYFDGRGYFSDDVGIGVLNPDATLDVAGTVKMVTFRLGNSATPGHVLTAFEGGFGSWQPLPSGPWNDGTGNDIYYNIGEVGIGTNDPLYPLHVVSSSGSTIKAVNSATLGDSPGLYAETASTAGRAVKGVATATSGSTAGVYGGSSSPTGMGLFGRNLVGGYGVYGEGDTSDGGWAGYFYGRGYFSDDVGIGRSDPQAKLDVNGTVKMTGLQLGSSTTAGYVLTADANGVGTWQEAATGGGSFDLPYDGTVTDSGPAFKITNNGTGQGAHGIFGAIPNASSADAAAGYFTSATGSGKAIVATASSNNAISARNNSSVATILAQNDGTGDVFNGRVGSDTVFRVAGTGITHVNVLAVEGGADLAERFDIGQGGEPGMVVEIDPDHAGKLRLSRGAYSRLVAGVISGANGVDAGMILGNLPGDIDSRPVALSGRVWVRCDASDRPIAPGDLITTAARPGYAMAVVNHDRAQGAVLGKAMTGLERGTGLVLVLVTLQ